MSSEVDLIPSQTSSPKVGEEAAAIPSPEPENVAQNTISASEGQVVDPDIELAYAAKAAILAPKHPFAQSKTITMEAEQRATEETTLIVGSLTDIKAQQPAQTEWQELTAEAQVATAPRTSATSRNVTQGPDDLVFRPFKYEGREVVVTGSVVHIFWNYRLKAETGQNSIVIDVAGLSQSDRAKLDAAIERVGFLGQVHARIKGRIQHQTLPTFHLVASELAVTGTGLSEGEILNSNSH